MNKKLLNLLNKNARYTLVELSEMLGITEAQVKEDMLNLEKQGVIRGYKPIIDWEKVDSVIVSAIIELKVTPKSGLGFEEVAERIMHYSEVESVYLMSGGYDLCVLVKGKTFQQVAMFVAKELSTIDSVISTSTHFVLRRYKEQDVCIYGGKNDDRGIISL